MTNEEKIKELSKEDILAYLKNRKYSDYVLQRVDDDRLRITATSEYGIDEMYGRSHELI